MSRVLVIGGSRGIGNNVIKEQLANGDECVNISRNSSGISDNLLQEFNLDVTKDDLPDVDKTLAAEFAPKVRVNCVAPTLTKTDLASRILRNERIEENIANKHPLKRICEAQDISSMVTFLISEKSKNITGQILRVDAGMSTLKI